MKDVIVYRSPTNVETGVTGLITIDGEPVCLTLELPWLDNARNISCIHEGHYICRRSQNPRRREGWDVLDVEGRTEVMFHIANVLSDLRGCIALGRYIGTLNGKYAILGSGDSFEKFNNIIGDDKEFSLTIRWS